MMESVKRIRERISEKELAREKLDNFLRADLEKDQYPYHGGLDDEIYRIDQDLEYLNSELLLRRLKDLDCPFPPSDVRKELWQQKLTDDDEDYEILSSSGVYEATEKISAAEERNFQRKHLVKSQKHANISQLISVIAAMAAVAAALVPIHLENKKQLVLSKNTPPVTLIPIEIGTAPMPKPLDLSFGPCSQAWQISSCPRSSTR